MFEIDSANSKYLRYKCQNFVSLSCELRLLHGTGNNFGIYIRVKSDIVLTELTELYFVFKLLVFA